jgi:hypothetical protein
MSALCEELLEEGRAIKRTAAASQAEEKKNSVGELSALFMT